jgi:drug/metabolite transporter (DMT)-like permease
MGTSTLAEPARNVAALRRHAILCVMAASACFTVSGALVKSVAGAIPVLEIMLFRSLVVTLVVLPMLLRQGGWMALRPRRPLGHVGRLICGFIGMLTSFYGVAHLPLATNTALGFCMPLFLTVLSIPLLGERVGWRRLSAVLVGLAGVLVMVRPWSADPKSLPPFVVAVVIGGVVAWALAMILIRRMGANGESNAAIVLWFSLGSTVIAGVACLPVWVWPTAWQLAALIGVGAVTAVAQLLMTEGYRSGDASVVAPFEYGAIVYTTVMGMVIWGEYPGVWNFVGIAIIVAAGLYIWRREVLVAAKSA